MNLELLQTLGKVKNYKKGELVCIEKEEGHTAYLLLEGQVSILLRSFHDQPKTVATLDPGAIFGEMSLLENKPRNASVMAQSENVMVLEIAKQNFLQILKSDKNIAYNLLCTLQSRMDKELDDMYRGQIAYVAEIRRDTLYNQIKKLSCEQFAAIIEKDADHAMRLLKFLSHSLAEINKKNANEK